MTTDTRGSKSQTREEQNDNIRVREGEPVKPWFRGDRFSTMNGQWFFMTREGHDVGPFSTREKAEYGLSLFIDRIVQQPDSYEHAKSVAKSGDWAVAFYQ